MRPAATSRSTGRRPGWSATPPATSNWPTAPGLRSVLVRTGDGGADGRYPGVRPGHVAADIVAGGRADRPGRPGDRRMIISRTPLRISFFGGGSDLPAYYRRHGGAVLSTTIDKSVYVTVSRKFDDAVRVSYSRTEEVARAEDVEHPLVREALGLLASTAGSRSPRWPTSRPRAPGGFNAAVPKFDEELSSLRDSPLARQCLDVPRMQKMLDSWPGPGNSAAASAYNYQLAFSRGIAAGHFIRRIEGGNR